MEDKIKRRKLMEILENKTTSLRTNIIMMLIMFVLSGVLFYLTQIILDMNLIWSIILSMGTMIVLYLSSQFIIIRIVTGSRDSQNYQNYCNSTTKLPGRMLFNDRLIQTLNQARHKNHMSAVMFLNIEKLKTANEYLGRNAAEALVKEISDRLLHCVNSDVTVGHFSDDEFAFIFPRVVQIYEAALIADRILSSISRPFIIEAQEILVSGYAGIGFYPIDGNDVQNLIKNTTEALKTAKLGGNANYQFCTSAMSSMVNEYKVMQNNLERALQRGEFLLHYQPQLNLADGKITGAEALIRWRHPALGLIIPGKFISTAEETGMMPTIGKWVLEQACKENKLWQDSGKPMITVAVNISPSQYIQNDFVDIVEEALKKSGMQPEYLELDFPESILDDMDRAELIFKRIHNLGVKISLDDFGTGFTSMRYMKGISIDTIKIDRSFINDILDAGEKNTLAAALISLGHSLNAKVLAIGVETKEQLILLKNHECDMIQGFYFSEPVSFEKFEILLGDGWCLKDNLIYHN